MELIDIRASQLDPVDLRGLPSVANGKTVWCTPDFFPKSGNGVLFLDELPQASSSMQSALFQLVLDRKIGEYILPEGWVVIAAGNRQEDRSGANRVAAALLNRFAVHMDMDVSVEDWSNWAVGAGIAPEVRAFINFRPTLLFQFDAASNPRAFATPRSWEKASKIFRVTPQRLLQRVLSGCVGEGPSAEFCAFLTMYQQLPDVDAVLANPTTHPLPKEPAVLFALIGALTEKCRNDKSLTPAYSKVGQRMPNEFGVLSLRDVLSIDRGLIINKDVQAWIAKSRSSGLFVS
jgi:hypothetical protein